MNHPRHHPRNTPRHHPRTLRRDLARRVFAGLSPLDRELLLMRYTDQLTDEEIAAVYGGALTVGEVGTLRRQAATRFRRRYGHALTTTEPPTPC